jgi:hypothetical protein
MSIKKCLFSALLAVAPTAAMAQAPVIEFNEGRMHGWWINGTKAYDQGSLDFQREELERRERLAKVALDEATAALRLAEASSINGPVYVPVYRGIPGVNFQFNSNNFGGPALFPYGGPFFGD